MGSYVLNVLNLRYGRLAHNSATVVPLQVFDKFRLLLPYLQLGMGLALRGGESHIGVKCRGGTRHTYTHTT